MNNFKYKQFDKAVIRMLSTTRPIFMVGIEYRAIFEKRA